MLLRDTTNSMDVLRQRYADSKHSSVTTMASTPLTDLSLTNHELGYNTTPTAGMTTFLPTLHSTPPMPTFQKPGMHPHSSPTATSSSNFTRGPLSHSKNINAFDFPHSGSAMSTTAATNVDSEDNHSQPLGLARRRLDTYAPENAAPRRIYIPHRSPETVDGYQLTAASEESPTRAYFFRNSSRAYSTTPLIDRIPDAPPLPGSWSPNLDRLICRLDAAGYDHIRIVQKVRELVPQLGGVLTPSMIDRRLRQLDQDIEIDYWRTGLRSKDASEARERVQTRDRQDRRAARESERTNAAREEQAANDHVDALQQQQGEQRHQNWSAMYGSATRGRDGASSPALRGGGGESSSRSLEFHSDFEAERRPRTVTQDFLGGFRSHNG